MPSIREQRFRATSFSSGGATKMFARQPQRRCRQDAWAECSTLIESLCVARQIRLAVAQQRAGALSGRLTVDKCRLAVDDNVAIALGALYAAPFAARQVVYHLDRRYLQLVEIVNYDVGGIPLLEQAAIGESGAIGGQGTQPPVRILEAQDR